MLTTDRPFWRGKRVLVGGGCGFLGSYIVPVLVERGANVLVVDDLSNSARTALSDLDGSFEFVEGDLREPGLCREVTRKQDVVLNLAAKAFGMEYSRSHDGEMLVHNLLCTLAPLEAARENDVQRYLIVSSSCVYPDDAPVPTPELDVFTGLPESVNEGYGWAKRIQELAGAYYARENGMKVAIVRPFNPYGGHYRWGSEEKAHVIPALVKRIMDGEDPLIVWGSGRQRRNFLHASDAARLILMVIERDSSGLPVNIGYDDDISIAELVDLICQAAGVRPSIVFDTSKPEGRFRKAADAALLRTIGPEYVPAVKLRDGIVEMIEWYRASFCG